jgi:pimeloyl-ACP methyl ester carboxylesterase
MGNPDAEQAFQRRAFSTSDGQTLSYQHWGVPGGCTVADNSRIPRVLWIQGVGVHGLGWTPQTSVLGGSESGCFECVSFDNRGIGESAPTGQHNLLSIERMAQDALELVDALGWDRFHVVGHSMGGLIAQALALSVPNRIDSMSLLCTFPAGKLAAPMSWRMLRLSFGSRVGTRSARRRAFLELVMPPASLSKKNEAELSEQLAPLFGHDLADHPPVEMKQVMAMRRYDARPALASLRAIPRLVLACAWDPIAPPSCWDGLEWNEAPHRHVRWEDASHGAPLMFVERTNALLREHILSAA